MEGNKSFNVKKKWALLAHACNPSNSGGRDQEDCLSKPAQTKKKGWWNGSR
jgi:hypothetical protein